MASLAQEYNYPLTSSPTQFVTILALYLLFSLKWGPNIMKNRDAFSLRTLMAVYNLAQVVLNALLCARTVKVVANVGIVCSPLNSSDSATDIEIRNIHYYYFLTKMLDILDTIFLVLRKKNSQVSLLHMHHHVIMIVTPWATFTYAPGGVLMWLVLFNTVVHVVMYFYYFLSLFDAAKAPWWKKYLTQLQIYQQVTMFVVFCIQFINWECTYPKILLVYCLSNTGLMIYLFCAFYVKNYIRKADSRTK